MIFPINSLESAESPSPEVFRGRVDVVLTAWFSSGLVSTRLNVRLDDLRLLFQPERFDYLNSTHPFCLLPDSF